MEYLLTEKNIKVLESFSLVDTLYAFDYDGTLAPIVNTPDKATMSEEVRLLLSELNNHVPVAIITGRSVSDIKKRLDFEPRFVIGNHGIEGAHDEEELKSMHHLTRTWLEKIASYTEKYLKPWNVVVEDKFYSLSLHYRNSHSPFDAENVCHTIASELQEAKVTRGKLVVNLVPRHGMNKGQAMEWILKNEKFKFGFYAGDDETDEEVFRYKNPKVMTVKIGEDSRTQAKYFLKSQREVEELLRLILEYQKKKLSLPQL